MSPITHGMYIKSPITFRTSEIDLTKLSIRHATQMR